MNATSAHNLPVYLIVSADDFGYFRCVSEGITHSHKHGIVTATAVLSNLDGFRDDARLLRECPDLDAGVHLNLTTGAPLSTAMKAVCRRSGGRFPPKFALLQWFLTRQITESDVEAEWRMQIEACLAAGVQPRFLNSHEHVHMLPWALPVVSRLSREFKIFHVRVPTPDGINLWPPGSLVRDVSLGVLAWRGSRSMERRPATFLGLGASGRLSAAVLRKSLSGLTPGTVYELMCHPGFHDVNEINDPRLLAYHDWEGEAGALTDVTLPQWLSQNGIRLISYRDLDQLKAPVTTRAEGI